MSIETLLNKQNGDGGWPYLRGGSWTEPTVYATLALLAAGEMEAAGRGLGWIRAAQRADGGWPPQLGVDQSTWVTALVSLLPAELLGDAAYRRAVRWLMGTAGEESSFFYRLRQRLLGIPQPRDQESPGWPWVPGAAAWVGPTSIALLALEKANRRDPSPAFAARIQSGRRFLLNRMCQEGGWNHGSARSLGYDLRPYPETTGMALAALRGVSSPKVDRGLDVAHNFLRVCRSADALNWLRLGLLAHGQLPPDYGPPAEVECRTLPETSLALLVGSKPPGWRLLWG